MVSGGRHRAHAAAADPYPRGGDVLQPRRYRHTPSGGGVVGTARGTLSGGVVRRLGGPWPFGRRVVAVAARGGGRVRTTDLRAVGASVPAVGGLLERWYRMATASPVGVSRGERVVVKPPYLHGKHNAIFGVVCVWGALELHPKFRMLPTGILSLPRRLGSAGARYAFVSGGGRWNPPSSRWFLSELTSGLRARDRRARRGCPPVVGRRSGWLGGLVWGRPTARQARRPCTVLRTRTLFLSALALLQRRTCGALCDGLIDGANQRAQKNPVYGARA